MPKTDPTRELAKALFAATSEMPRGTNAEKRAAYEEEARVAQAFFHEATRQYAEIIVKMCTKNHKRAPRHPCATCYPRVQIATMIGNVVAPEYKGFVD